VHLQIYSPGQGRNTIALELIIYNRDEEFYVNIASEEGKTICQGVFSRFSADRVKCAYDTGILRDGDNAFHVTITSVATKEIVLDTVSHFFYDSNRVAEGSISDDLSETWDAVIAAAVLALLLLFGGRAYRSVTKLLVQTTTSPGGSLPPLPPPSPPAPEPIVPGIDLVGPFAADPAPTVNERRSSQLLHSLRNDNVRLLQALLVGVSLLVGGKAVLGSRRISRPSEQPHLLGPAIVPAPEQSAAAFGVPHYQHSVVTQTVGVTGPRRRTESAVLQRGGALDRGSDRSNEAGQVSLRCRSCARPEEHVYREQEGVAGDRAPAKSVHSRWVPRSPVRRTFKR
jgi:hypothetical protein